MNKDMMSTYIRYVADRLLVGREGFREGGREVGRARGREIPVVFPVSSSTGGRVGGREERAFLFKTLPCPTFEAVLRLLLGFPSRVPALTPLLFLPLRWPLGTRNTST